MANVYILTKENRKYNEDGIKYILDKMRNHYHDYSDINIAEGPLYNDPSVLCQFLKDDVENSYVFISYATGIATLYTENDINHFIDILENNTDENTTSWLIIMSALGLLENQNA